MFFESDPITAYRQVLGSMVGIFKQHLNKHSDATNSALVLATLCVGGMVLARAVGDEQLADKTREAARKHAFRNIADEHNLMAMRLSSVSTQPGIE